MNPDLPIQMFDFPPRARRAPQAAGLSRSEATKKRGFKRRLIRLPTALWDKLDLIADANWRNTTQEVRVRLEASVENQSIDEHGVIVEHCPALRK